MDSARGGNYPDRHPRSEGPTMTQTPLTPVLREVRKLAGLRVAAAQSDNELLESFLAGHDEAAFAALVRRHGPMVLGVCRHALGTPPEAGAPPRAPFPAWPGT